MCVTCFSCSLVGSVAGRAFLASLERDAVGALRSGVAGRVHGAILALVVTEVIALIVGAVELRALDHSAPRQICPPLCRSWLSVVSLSSSY
jgi:hypothetical protein